MSFGLSPRLYLCVVIFGQLVLGSLANAQSGPPPAKIFGLGLGQLDSLGWADAKSTEGGFQVKTPCNYNDMTMGKQDGAGTTLRPRLFSVACERQDRVQFTAIRLEQVERSASAAMEAMIGGMNLPAESVSVGMVGGIKTKEIRYETATRCFFARLFQIQNDVMLVMVEPVGVVVPCVDLRADAQKFLDSWKVSL